MNEFNKNEFNYEKSCYVEKNKCLASNLQPSYNNEYYFWNQSHSDECEPGRTFLYFFHSSQLPRWMIKKLFLMKKNCFCSTVKIKKVIYQQFFITFIRFFIWLKSNNLKVKQQNRIAANFIIRNNLRFSSVFFRIILHIIE